MQAIKHTAPQKRAHTWHLQEKFVPVVALVFVCMLFFSFAWGLWNYGLFFPSWVQWHTFSREVDVNGDGQLEAVSLMNRHLVVVDSNDNEYVTPREWMVADVELGDLTGDGAPEILVLTWEHARDNERAVLEVPLLGRAFGFNQHVHVFDYVDGDVRYLWDSAPLNIEACDIHMADEGVVCINLPNDSATYWRWENPGLTLRSNGLLNDPVIRLG